MSTFYRPGCWVLGHVYLPTPDKPGWHSIFCNRCGFDWTKSGHRRSMMRFRTAQRLVKLANSIDSNTPSEGYQRINGIEYISRKSLENMIKQGDDMLISAYLSEEGWIKIGEDNAEEMVELINKSFTYEATRREQEELNEDN